MNRTPPHSPSTFFVLVFAFSLPFYAVGALAPQLSRWIPLGLPINVLMVICPVGIALWLTHRDEGRAGMWRLLGRVFDYRISNKIWLLLALGIMPVAMLLSYMVQQLVGQSLPQPAWSLAALLFGFAVYFVGAIGEELGWMGYAIDPLQARYGFLTASVGLGVLWWLWHVIPYHVTGRSTQWILWQGLATVMFRVIMVWIYNRAGRSILTSILFHTMINIGIDAFPQQGSHYDPMVTSLILVGITLLLTWRQLTHRLVVGLGALGLAAFIVLRMALPVFRFPQPSGPYPIGTLTYHWVDANRPEIFSVDPNTRRELMVQIWYPATGDSSAPRAPYMQEADVVTAAFAQIHHFPAFLFGQFKYVTTNALASAPVADGEPRYPVLLFLEGATGFRQMNTFQVEELVSHGYIVAAIDQPGAAANVVFPDGHQIATLSVEQLVALIRPSYRPDQTVPLLNGRVLTGGSIIPYLTQDVIFTLNQLAVINQADPNGILTGRLDMLHVGTFGVSLGGIVAPTLHLLTYKADLRRC